MSYSSPVAIPLPKARKRLASQHSGSSLSPLSIASASGSSLSLELVDSFSTCPCSDITCAAAPTSEECSAKSPHTDDSGFIDACDCHPFSPPRLNFSRSSSTISTLSTPTSPSLRLTRALSPPREEVTADDPLRINQESEDQESEDEHVAVSPSNPDEAAASFQTPKRPARRKSQFKSSLTASLSALKGKLPVSLPSPAIYTPSLLPRPEALNIQIPEPPQPLSTSLPVFDISPIEEPTSSAVHLQTYSVSLGPPRKPREARLNSDFLRLLALEMEMRRSGKFGFTPDIAQGIVVSEKVRMILPRRCDRERDDVNMSMFNRSRLKW